MVIKPLKDRTDMDDTALDAPEKGVRRWRLAGWIAAGLLVVLLGLVLIAPGLIDWNAYKDRFETMMSTALGRQVVIAGDLSFRTLPTPALRAADVRIGNVPDGRADYLAKAERLDAVVALFPLLRGDIRIRRIELIAPEIALERTADGRGNWQLGGEAPKEPDISETDSAMAAISVDDFVVRKGTLSFYDAQSMQEFKASAIELRLVAESLSGPFQGQARMQVADVPLDLSIKASRFERAARVPVSVTMTVRDAKATLSGWFRLQDADAHMPQMALAAGIDVPDLAVLLGDMGAMASHPLPVIAGLDQPFSLEGDLSVDGDIRLSDLRGKFAATTLSGALEYIMEDDPALTATVRADQIDLDPFFAKDAVDAVAAEGASTFPEKTVNWPDVPKDLALTLSLAVDAAHYRGGMISRATMDLHSEDGVLVIEQARANLPGASSLSLNGQLSQKGENPQLAGTLKASSSNVRAVLDWLEIALPIPRDRLSSLVFESAVKATPNDIAFDDLSLVLDASHVEGTVLMVFGPDQPALEADIRVDRLALDDYFLPPAPDAPPFDRVDLSRRANDMLVDSESLDLRLKLALGRLSAFGQDLRDVQLVLDRHLDALTVERAAFKNQEGADFGFSGRVQAGDDIPGIDMLVRGSLPDLARAVDALAVTSPPFLRPVGSVTFEGRIAGALTDVEVDLGGQLAGGRLTARGKAGSALDPKAGTLDLDLTVDHPSHRALAARFGFDALAHGDALPVHLEAQLSGPAMGLDVAGKGRLLGGQMDVTGQMAGHDGGQNLELDITATHPELAQLVRQVIPDYRPRKAELGPLSGHLSVAYDASSHRLGLKIAPSEVGPSRVSGTLDVKLAKDRPFLTVELDLGAVPLPDFLPPASTGIMPARKTGTRRWSQEPLALEGLRGFDGTLALAAQMMTLDPWRLDAPVVEARLDQGVLTLDAVTGKLFGGDLLMSGALDVGDVPDLSLTYALKDSRFADVLEATLGHGIIDGQGSVAGAFSAKGNSQFDMVSSVSGQSRVHIQNGALIGVDLPGLVRGLKGASSAKGLGALAFNAFSSGQTPFTDMTVDLQAQKGLVQMAPMRAALAAGQMESRASLDLGAWALSMTGTFRLEDYPKAPPIGFDLGGAVSNPTIALDTDPLLRWRAAQLATSVFKRLDIPGSDLLKAPDVVGTKPGSDVPLKEDALAETPPRP